MKRNSLDDVRNYAQRFKDEVDRWRCSIQLAPYYRFGEWLRENEKDSKELPEICKKYANMRHAASHANGFLGRGEYVLALPVSNGCVVANMRLEGEAERIKREYRLDDEQAKRIAIQFAGYASKAIEEGDIEAAICAWKAGGFLDEDVPSSIARKLKGYARKSYANAKRLLELLDEIG
ncbi:MAG TPA: hypothetical protein ENG42_03315 [Candidatus Aenigmarchaeota archaeon]|nr:MAG: hypothetical protein DRP03_00365 [Candidatus Aenigmarchaeota archaeon]HDD46481.1 hypothetical protein [Candidatus Aenigmarchaeota archaeon]